MKLMFDEKQTGKNIKAYRKQWGWSKKELAERADVAVALVELLEAGNIDPRMSAITDIANALNVHPDWLLAWKPEDEE